MSPKDAGGIANSVDPEQSDLGLHCLPRPVSRKLRIITVNRFCSFHFSLRVKLEQVLEIPIILVYVQIIMVTVF